MVLQGGMSNTDAEQELKVNTFYEFSVITSRLTKPGNHIIGQERDFVQEVRDQL